ncbi:MAG: hypothetical protein OXC95_09220 [Dehalococcoidia bacterium]|nr:hypothetical protein [Dehalococcoidia bacterium]
MQSDDQNHSRPSMLSVPARWRELYFNVFSILCVLGEIFLVWYEIYRRDAESGYLDIIMNILLDVGPVAMAAAILAFIILKGRDAMLSTWETFARKRYAKGREDGREEGREERQALAKRVSELEEQIRDIRNSNGSSQS